EIKRRLMPALQELEEASFLAPLSLEERFMSEARGEWKVIFIAAAGTATPEKSERRGEPTLKDDLIALGVHAQVASSLLDEFRPERVAEKVRFVRELLGKKDKRVSRNPAGFLVNAIREDYSVARKPKSPPSTERSIARRSRTEVPRTADDGRTAIDTFLSKLSEAERDELEARAVANADGILAKHYHEGKGTGGTLFLAARQAIIDAEVRRALP